MTGNEDVKEIVKVPKKFLIEALTGIMVFIVIAGAAVGLSIFVKYLDKIGIDIVIIVGLRLAEYSIFLADLLLFGRFLWKTCKRTWGEL